MPDNKIVNLPEMNSEGISLEELKAKEGSEGETETPAESPTVEKPDDEPSEEETPEGEESEEEEPEEEVVDDAQKGKGAIEGLGKTKEKLISDITNLRAKRRTLEDEDLPVSKKESEEETPPQIDEDDDTDPETAKTIDRRVQKALKSGEYVKRSEIETQTHRQKTNQAVDEWVRDEHPEYLPESADDLWMVLKSELKQYGQPASPEKIKDLLNLAHGAIVARFPDRFPSDSAPAQVTKKQQLKVAGMGTGGKGGDSSRQSSLTPKQKETYRRGGWTEKEIRGMDK